MVARFSKYQGPIALRFEKEKQMTANIMAQYLQQLTNLTGLSMSKNVKSTSSTAEKNCGGFTLKFHKSYFEEQFSLSTLTNLQEWYSMPSFGENTYDNISNFFSRLTKFKFEGRLWNEKPIERILRNNTNLEVLDLDSTDVDLLSILPNPDRLTALTLPRNNNIKEDEYSKFSNLRHIGMNRGGFYRALPALESIETQGHFISYFDVNTTLTRLDLTSSSDEILKMSLPNLVNLRELTKCGKVGRCIDVPLYLQPEKLTKLHIMQEEEESLENMSRLTNLEYLHIFRSHSETDQETIGSLSNLTKLTQLSLHMDIKTDSSLFISNLTNIKLLTLRGDLKNLTTADVATKFSKLEELRLNEYFIGSFSANIEVLHEPSCYHTILTNFKNLTRLQLHNKSPDLMVTLTQLGNLKSLTLGWMDANYLTALTKLTAITDLDIHAFENKLDRNALAKMTNLQRLWLRHEDKKDKEFYYEKLPYLYKFTWRRNN